MSIGDVTRAQFMATFDPVTVAALLDEIEQARLITESHTRRLGT